MTAYRANRLLFILLLLPLVVLGELIRYIHGREKDLILDAYRTIYLRTRDDTTITAMRTDKASSRVILLVHGYLGSTKNWISGWKTYFEQLEHDIVALDLRNHGTSQLSLPITVGHDEQLDVQVALKYCRTHWDEVVLVGSSMGVYSSLYAVTNLEKHWHPDKIVFESFGTDVKLGISNFFTTYARFPQLLSRLLVIYFHLRAPEIFERDILQELQQLDIEIMIAHGAKEQVYPPAIIQPILKSKLQYQSSYHVVKDSTHSKLWDKDEYLRVFADFIQ